MKKKLCFASTLLFLFTLMGCQYHKEETAFEYLFLGHTYDWNQGDRIDPRLEQVDFRSFDQIWLGGDICSRTTQNEQTLRYLDSHFNLDSPATHWAIGNHDILDGRQEWIESYTGRPSFYTTWVEGICLMVLNTNYFWFYPSAPPQENCEKKEAQLAMIRSVCDTIRQASHLVILHHHALLADKVLGPGGQPAKAFNANYPNPAIACDSTRLFTDWVYPMLTKVQARGVQVILAGGDMGTKAKQFNFRTPEGIRILGSGINNSLDPKHAPAYVTNFDPDKVLVFRHYPSKKLLDLEFVPLNKLAGIK